MTKREQKRKVVCGAMLAAGIIASRRRAGGFAAQGRGAGRTA